MVDRSLGATPSQPCGMLRTDVLRADEPLCLVLHPVTPHGFKKLCAIENEPMKAIDRVAEMMPEGRVLAAAFCVGWY